MPNQYALATVAGAPVNQGDHVRIPISGLTLASGPLRSGLTGLSAVGGSSGAPPDYSDLQAQVATLTTQVADLQARVSVLEGGPPGARTQCADRYRHHAQHRPG